METGIWYSVSRVHHCSRVKTSYCFLCLYKYGYSSTSLGCISALLKFAALRIYMPCKSPWAHKCYHAITFLFLNTQALSLKVIHLHSFTLMSSNDASIMIVTGIERKKKKKKSGRSHGTFQDKEKQCIQEYVLILTSTIWDHCCIMICGFILADYGMLALSCHHPSWIRYQ